MNSIYIYIIFKWCIYIYNLYYYVYTHIYLSLFFFGLLILLLALFHTSQTKPRWNVIDRFRVIGLPTIRLLYTPTI